ncbi:MAG TPA: wax ester/triacylglycerol synthase family O-acyltransferase [Actinomycetota bacterium]
MMDRLGPQDLMMVWPEELGWSQDIGAIAILDGRGFAEEDGGFPIEAIREHVRGRLHLLPRFRQRLHRPPLGLGWPLWVDAPSIDLRRHVRMLPLEGPADEERLLATCERLRRRRLDRSRPLWELWFLPGLTGGRVGFYMRLHHAVADGVAGIAALGAFVDPVPDPPQTPQPTWRPRPTPTAMQLLADNVRWRLATLGRFFDKLAHPSRTLRAARRGWPAVREAFIEERAPRTSLNRRVGWDRRLDVIRVELDAVKRIAHAHGGKVNDVLLAAVAGGARALLLGRGERVEGLSLRAFVPVSLHGAETDGAGGNLDGAMMAPLPIGEKDPRRTLRRIAAETAERKRKPRPPGGTLFRNVPIQRAWLRYAPHQRVMNTYVANVPGPPVPLYFAGAPVLEAFPVVPLIGNVTIGVGALSYAGQFNLTVVADRDACPDLERFVVGARRTLDALARATGGVVGDGSGTPSTGEGGKP